MRALAIRLLGGFEATVQGEPLPKLRSRVGLRVLALLALHRPRPLERRYLAGLLWPGTPEEQGLALLRRTLTDLRRALGEQAEGVQAPSKHTLRLSPGDDIWLDTEALEAHLAVGQLNEASTLYRGPLLQGWNDDWVLPERERLQLLFVEALERKAARCPPDEAAALLRRALTIEPHRETTCRALLETLAAQGDTAGMTAAYQHLTRTLKRVLGTTPDDETTALYRKLQRTPPRLPTSWLAITTPPHPLTRFVGREAELAALFALLGNGSCRLLTLTGPGGSGKTRLSLEAARKLKEMFPGGTGFVALSEVATPERVPIALARAVGAAPGTDATALERTKAALTAARGRVLLVLDNLEHLLVHPNAPDLRHALTALLTDCPTLVCLTTSRVPLRLSGEREFPVGPLPLTDSTSLFTDRARSLRPVGSAQSEGQIALLCARLEGSPLAIELAAGSLRSVSLPRLLERLDSPLELAADHYHDVPERHRSLRAVLESSYALLSSNCQQFLAALSVFRGGCNDASAAAVGNAPDPLPFLRTLEEHSLVRSEDAVDGERRYSLQEVVRAFAAEKLEQSGQRVATEQRHAAQITRLAEQVQQGLPGPEQEHWHQVMDRDIENVRAALDNLAAAPTPANVATYLQLLAGMSRYWERRSCFQEAYQRCETGLTLHGTPHTLLSAQALLRFAIHCWRLREWERSKVLTEEALTWFEANEVLLFQSDAHQNLGNVVMNLGDATQAHTHFILGLELARRCNDPHRVAQLTGNLGWAALLEGRIDDAIAHYEDQLAQRRALGDLGRVARSLSHLGNTTAQKGDFAKARRYLTESLLIHRRLQNDFATASDLFDLGEVALASHSPAEATAFFHEALTLDLRLGMHAEALKDLEALARTATQQKDWLRAVHLWAAHGVQSDTLSPALEAARMQCRAAHGEQKTLEAELSGRMLALEEL
jgi:predicted ATPase/DNA-binding SARP family transcriptional activator